jgi:adenylate cyclase
VIVGLGLSAVGAKRLVRTLWRVVDGAKAIEAGDLTVTVPVTSRDEMGQLAEAFNSMAGQLRTKERIKDTFGKYVDPRVVAQLIDTTKENIDQAGAPDRHRPVLRPQGDSPPSASSSRPPPWSACSIAISPWWPSRSAPTTAFSRSTSATRWWRSGSPRSPPATPTRRRPVWPPCAHRDAVIALRPELPQLLGLRRNVPDLTVRMGLATGEVVVGTVGAPTAKSFAVIGDTTNLASRLEGVNKIYGTTIIVAEETFRLAQNVIEARELDSVVVVGKSEAVRIFELMGLVGAVESGTLELRDVYGTGLEAYRRQDWDAAEHRFSDCLRLCPDDGPSRVLRARIEAFRAGAPGPDWNGVWYLGEK